MNSSSSSSVRPSRSSTGRHDAGVELKQCGGGIDPSSGLLSAEPSPGGIARVLWTVAILGIVINALSISASHLWLRPDSRWYIELAVGIAERLDFSDERFVVRTPGYPLMLGGIFAALGRSSPTAILLIQHGMVVAIAVLTALTGWYISGSRAVALIGGCMTACGLQLLSFANVVLTEVPYTLALVAAVCLLVKYHRQGGVGRLAAASLLGGVSYLFRPVGMTVVAMCVAAACHRGWFAKQTSGPRGSAFGASTGDAGIPGSSMGWRKGRLVPTVMGGIAAIVPALAVTAPYMIHNARAQDSQQAGCTIGLSLYHRVAFLDRLDSSKSDALAEIQEVVDQAKQAGQLSYRADSRRWWDVWRAYQRVRGATLAEAGTVISRAAFDLAGEHWRRLARETPINVARTLLMPDGNYRFHPGYATGPGMRLPDDVAIYDTGHYMPALRRYMNPEIFERYLPLSSGRRGTTPIWASIAESFHQLVERGAPITGLADSPYEEFILFCMLGGVLALLARERSTWLLVGGVVASQVVISALLAGVVPRYAVPVQPLLNLYGAFLTVGIARACARVLGMQKIMQVAGQARGLNPETAEMHG